MGRTFVSARGGAIVLSVIVVTLALTVFWVRPWRPALTSVSTGEVSCAWAGGRAVVQVPIRVEGRGEVPISVRGFVHRVREPRAMPYLATRDVVVPAGTRRVVEVSVPLSRQEWREGRAACSAAVAVGEDPPTLP